MEQGNVSSSVAKFLEDAFYTQKILSNFVLYGFKSPYPEVVKQFILSIFNKIRSIIACRKLMKCCHLIKIKIVKMFFISRCLLS